MNVALRGLQLVWLIDLIARLLESASKRKAWAQQCMRHDYHDDLHLKHGVPAQHWFFLICFIGLQDFIRKSVYSYGWIICQRADLTFFLRS